MAMDGIDHSSPVSVKRRVLVFTATLSAITLAGTGLSLMQLGGVRSTVARLQEVSLPLGRAVAQLQSDGEVFRRERDRRLAPRPWSANAGAVSNGASSSPERNRTFSRGVPPWIEEVIAQDIERIEHWSGAISTLNEASPEWRKFLGGLRLEFDSLRQAGARLREAAASPDAGRAASLQTDWLVRSESLLRRIRQGDDAFERWSERVLARAEAGLGRIETGLQLLLLVVVSLSFLLIWLGERALRPLAELTRLATEIAERGSLLSGDKQRLSELSGRLALRPDEVGSLTREFRKMASALLERERTVEHQKIRLEEQNRSLRELGELRERLRDAEQLATVGRMSAQVAHEVRNPLHSVGLEAELALESIREARASQSAGGAGRLDRSLGLAQSALESIGVSLERMGKITENYLKFSRLSSGKRSRFDLEEAIEEVLATYGSQCTARRVRVDWTLGEGGSQLVADRELVTQAIGNLFRNAIQAVESQPEPDRWIRLALARAGGGAAAPGCRSGRAELVLVVEDGGPGVPADARKKLFTPFFTTRAQGTGLGLSFVRQVAEAHAGSVALREAAGGGASFELRMPAAPPLPPGLAAPAPSGVDRPTPGSEEKVPERRSSEGGVVHV